jgi:glutamate-1-semialdehyde-2,1-aminomutase
MTRIESPKGLALHAEASSLSPGGVNSATRYIGAPYAFTDADGAYLFDADGRRYVDYHAAFGAIILGHNSPLIAEAVHGALDDVDLVGLGVTEREVEFARLVTELIPSAEQVITTMSGTEATFHAIRLARAATGRSLVIKFQGCFHGWHDAVARNVISPLERAYQRDPLSAGILDNAVDSTLIAEFNDLDSVDSILEAHPDEVACVILEPVPQNVGCLLPQPRFLEELKTMTRRAGAILIFDEVVTGFRHALGGFQEIAGVLPDLTTFGKCVGNGLPVSGLAGRRDLMQRFSSAGGDVLLAGTFNGNAISMAAAIATMTYLRDHREEAYGRLYSLGERMRAGLSELVERYALPAQVAGWGSTFTLYFLEGPIRGYRDLLRNDAESHVAFCRGMTEHGALLLPLNLKRNHVSLAHTGEDVDRTLEIADRVLRKMSGRITPRQTTPA